MKIGSIRTIMRVWVLGFIGCLWLSTAVHADNSFVLSPVKAVEEGRGYYKDQVKPGDTREYTFIVRNAKDTPVQLKLYPADASPLKMGAAASRKRSSDFA